MRTSILPRTCSLRDQSKTQFRQKTSAFAEASWLSAYDVFCIDWMDSVRSNAIFVGSFVDEIVICSLNDAADFPLNDPS